MLHTIFFFKLEIYHLIHTKSNKWNQNVINFLVKQKFICFLKYIHYTYVPVPSHFSHVWLFVTLWTVAHQDPLSMGFTRQEYWSRLPFPSPYIYIYIYTHKSFYTMLDKCLIKNIKKKKRDRDIGKHKLNEMGALNMK